MRDAHSESSIRAYCDGELAPEEAATIERAAATDADLRQRIEAERGLRGAVERALASEKAPPNLADRVGEALAAAPEGDALDPEAESLESTDAPDTSAPAAIGLATGRRDEATRETRHAPDAAPAVAGRVGVSWSAVAAVLVLIAGAVLAGMLLPQIDEWGRASKAGQSILEAAAEHVDAEHDRCADAMVAAGKFTVAFADAGGFVSHHLGLTGFTPANLGPLGYEFVGVGPCMVPGFDRSVHLLYRRGETGPMVSVFVVANNGVFDHIGEIGPAGTARRTVRVLRNREVVLLVCCCVSGDLGAVSEATARATGCVMDPTDARVP